jgi:hypothetical protein
VSRFFRRLIQIRKEIIFAAMNFKITKNDYNSHVQTLPLGGFFTCGFKANILG